MIVKNRDARDLLCGSYDEGGFTFGHGYGMPREKGEQCVPFCFQPQS